MIKVLLFDFSRTLIHPKPISFIGKLNDLYKEVSSSKEFNFSNHFKLNQEILNFISSLRKKYTLAIYTTDILQNDPAVKPTLEEIFHHIFAANDLSINKREPEGYFVIAKKLEVSPEEILFVDDLMANITAAHKAGVQTIQFTTNEDLFENLRKLL